MSNEKELSVLIKMRADIDAAIAKVNNSLDSIGKKSDKSSDSMTKGFKKALQPINNVRIATLRFAAVWGFAAGAVIKMVNETGKEIDSLDSLSYKLGMTTEDLSKKIYGFNIATDKARIGIASLNIVSDTWKRTWEGIKFKTSELTGFLGQAIGMIGTLVGNDINAFRGGPIMGVKEMWDFTGQDIKRQNQDIKENSRETLEARANLENKIRQMKLSTYEYQKVLLSQEVNDMKIAGLSETKIREYQAAREQQLIEQRFGFKRFTDFMDSQFSSTITSMKGTMSSFFNDAFMGQLKKGKEYFADFGESLLKTFSDIISEMIARWIFFGSVTGAIGSGSGLLGWIGFHGGGTVSKAKINVAVGSAFGSSADNADVASKLHGGGVIRAHQGLALDEVPAILQTGERVLSRSQNRNYERMMDEGYTKTQIIVRPTVVISAWDAADVKRHEKQISSMVTNAVRNDPQLREAIKKYG